MDICMLAWGTAVVAAILTSTDRTRKRSSENFCAWTLTMGHHTEFPLTTRLPPISRGGLKSGHTACETPGAFLLIVQLTTYILPMWVRTIMRKLTYRKLVRPAASIMVGTRWRGYTVTHPTRAAIRRGLFCRS